MDHSVPAKVHWFSIVNSLLIVLFLSAMVGMILIRTLHRDITNYNRDKSVALNTSAQRRSTAIDDDDEDDDELEETGWKLVYADVFRAPVTNPMLFCVFVGTGWQLYGMALVTILFSAIGFLSPANRGSLMIALLLLFVMMGSVAGYVSVRLYKTFNGTQFTRNSLFTALFFPIIAFGIFFFLNTVVWAYGSSGAVPFVYLLAVIFLWVGISCPLVYIGSCLAYQKDAIEFPVGTSNVPKQIPPQPWYLSPPISALLGGILPFGACFVELFFILSSIWMDQYYYVFGFLLLVFVILSITCAEMTMVLTYFQLCSEDYHWWWRSFLSSGSTALYVFLYSVLYYSRLEGALWVTSILYFGYMAIISLAVFLLTGAVGFTSSLWFNLKIYGAIKVE
jgi:transmembrane 9 superfamily protein 2/4